MAGTTTDSGGGRPAERGFTIARRVAGRPLAGDLVVIRAGGRPRWIVGAGMGARGPRRAGVWRPADAMALSAAYALDAAAAAGRLGERLGDDDGEGLAGLLGRELGIAGLELGGVSVSPRRQRCYATLFREGRMALFAKVVASRTPLEREQRVLEALARAGPRSFVAPRPVALVDWNELSVLVLEPLAPRGLAVRAFGERDASVLAELAGLGAELAPALGSAETLVPLHGDFVPWNTGRVGSGYAVWDWESSRLGPPLHDFFHWHVQSLARIGEDGIEPLVQLALLPVGPLETLRLQLGLERDAPARSLLGYLRVRRRHAGDPPAVRRMVDRGLALLGEDETADGRD